MIEIGRKYRVVKSSAGNIGKIVTIIGYAGEPGFDGFDLFGVDGDRWFIDVEINVYPDGKVNHVGELQLHPADEIGSWESLRDIWIPKKDLA